MKARTTFTVVAVMDAHKNIDLVVVGEDAGYVVGGRDATGKYQQLESDKLSHLRKWEQQHGFHVTYQTRELFIDMDEDNGTFHSVDIEPV
jgi:hypothetical protein